MRILYIAPRFPYPPHRGDRLTGYHFIRTMSRHHDVTLLSFVDGSEPREAVAALQQWCEAVEVHRLPRWRSWLQAWAGLASSQPSQVSYYASEAMAHAVRERVTHGGFDAVFVQLIRMAPFVRGLDHPLKILFVGDSLATNLRRSLAYTPAWKHAGVKWEAARVARFEVEATADFRESWMLSTSETQEMVGRGAQRVATVRHGVDESLFAIEPVPASPPLGVFLGNLSVPHNVDAAGFAAREVWPLVRARMPSARLCLVGADAVPAVRALGTLEGVEVAGFVPDLAELWRGASVMLAPLRYSTGIQNKVLEAMAAGVPVVATPAVAEAIGARDGAHVLVAESAGELADAVCTTLADPGAARTRAAAAREHVRRCFRWDEAVERLEALVGEGVVADGPVRSVR